MGQHAGLRQCWCQQNSLLMSAVWKELSVLEGHDVGGGSVSHDVGSGPVSHDVGGGYVSPVLVTSAGPGQGHENSHPKWG